jgi:hypothetical protein
MVISMITACDDENDVDVESWIFRQRETATCRDDAGCGRTSFPVPDSIFKKPEFKEPSEYAFAIPRATNAPGYAPTLSLLKIEGAGKAGCRLHPWVPCNKKHGGRTTGSTGINRLSPRNGFTAYT